MTPKQANELAGELLQWAAGSDALQIVGSKLYAATMRGELPELELSSVLDAVDALRNLKRESKYSECVTDYDIYEAGDLADRLYAYAMHEVRT